MGGHAVTSGAPGGDVAGSVAVAADGVTGSIARRLESILLELPAAVAILRGPTHVFEFANPLYVELTGGRDPTGLPVREALPEIEGQGYFELLDEVYRTGRAYRAREARVLIDRGGGALEEAWLNFAYTPTRDAGGAVDGMFVHAVDVSELVRSRQTVEALAADLELERTQLATVIEQMPAGVVIAAVPSGRLLMANERWREFFGVSIEDVDDIAGYRVFRGFHPDGREYDGGEYPLARAVRSGEIVAGEQIEILRRDGARRFIEVTAAPIHDVAGGIVAGVAAFFDVTAPRRAAALVERHKQVLELVAQGGPLERTLELLVRAIEEQAPGELMASLLVLDRDGRHLRHGAAPSLPQAYNEAIDGIEVGPAVGSCGTAAFRGERVVVTDIATDPLWAGFHGLAAEHALRACWSTPVLASGGDVLGTFAIYYTEPRAPLPDHEELVALATRTAAIAIQRRRLEQEAEANLRAAQARAQAALALEHVDDGVILVDRDGVVRLWNPAAAATTRVPPERALGRPLGDVLSGWRAIEREIPRAASPQQAGPTRTLPLAIGGRELWLSLSAVDFAGGTVFAFRDRTEERRLEELRSELIATVSHEVRTPLTAVYGAARTLQREDLRGDEELRDRLVDVIADETERLSRIVDSILLASRIEARGVAVAPGAVDAAEVCRSVVEAARARGAGSPLRLDLPEGLPRVAADRERLHQVLANLVDNALKYGVGGEVDVSVRRHGDALRLEVGDAGPGVPAHEADRIFERFYRLDPNQTSGVAGTGLGLYISRELVHRMQGEIWVEPSRRGGAAFVVQLPVAG